MSHPGDPAKCIPCKVEFPTTGMMIAHLFEYHADDAPELWPDGELVIFDEELMP